MHDTIRDKDLPLLKGGGIGIGIGIIFAYPVYYQISINPVLTSTSALGRKWACISSQFNFGLNA